MRTIGIMLIILMVVIITVLEEHEEALVKCEDDIGIIQKYEELLIKNRNLENELKELKLEYENFVKKYFIIDVTLTAYTARREETNNDPENTALMQKPVSGWTVAVSRDLIHLLGKTIYIEGVGVRYVNDLMNKRFVNTIDILMPTVQAAREFGVKENVRISLVTN